MQPDNVILTIYSPQTREAEEVEGTSVGKLELVRSSKVQSYGGMHAAGSGLTADTPGRVVAGVRSGCREVDDGQGER
jgi:hypothetical protein